MKNFDKNKFDKCIEELKRMGITDIKIKGIPLEYFKDKKYGITRAWETTNGYRVYIVDEDNEEIMLYSEIIYFDKSVEEIIKMKIERGEI